MAMAESRMKQNSLSNYIKSEKELLDWLHNSKQLIPKKRKDFTNFIYQHYELKDVPLSVVRSVWMQLKNFEKKNKECPTIVLSSDDEVPVVTEILDFDAMDNENEPNIRVIEIPQQPVVKSPEKEKKKKEYHRQSIHNKTSPKNKTTNAAEDQALLTKFKRQIILEELLKRDKEMVKIHQRKDKFQTAVQIEMLYAKRIQKEHVENLALEMLRLHKAGFRDVSTNSLGRTVTLVDPPLVFPGQNAIVERLPSPEPQAEIFSQDISNDQINYDMLYPDIPLSDCEKSSKNNSKRRKKSDLSSSLKKKNRSKSFSGETYSSGKSKKEIEAERLREKLYLDTLIEMALPEVVEEVNGVHRLIHDGINTC